MNIFKIANSLFYSHHASLGAIEPNQLLVKQGPKHMHPDLAKKVEADIDKLVNVGFIRKVRYPVWLANIVPVKKKNGKIWVIDFRGINNKGETRSGLVRFHSKMEPKQIDSI